MYPVRLGYNEAINRIKKLAKGGHHAESFVTSVFTAEKTLRRTLKALIVSAGFKSTIAKKIIGQLKGLDAIKEAWKIYDPTHKEITKILEDRDWQVIKEAANKRNKLVHGERVYDIETYKAETNKILEALDSIKSRLDEKYGYSGWDKVAIRKTSKLHLDPRVKIIK